MTTPRHAANTQTPTPGRKAQIELLPMQPGDVERTYADIDAIQRDLGYNPRTTIEQGIPAFVQWYRAYHRI